MNHFKVLHTEWSMGWGGQEIRVIGEMEKMRELGCELGLATRENAVILQEAQKRGFATYVLPFARKTDLNTIFSLRKIIKEHQYNIINTHSEIDTWCGGFAALLNSVKFIRTRHLSNPIDPSLFNFINQLADFVFTTGEQVRESMIKNNRIASHRVLSIPTGINLQRFDPEKYDKKECREKLNLPQDAVIVGNLGVLRKFKRQDLFIRIAAQVKNAYFVIAGKETEEMKEYLLGIAAEEGVQDRIIFLGHLEKPEYFLKAIDIFLMTSDRNEGVPQSLMQALAMELPCIASNIGSIRDLHYCDSEGENFILLHSNPTEEEYTMTLKRLLEHMDLVTPNRLFISTRFSEEIMGEKILNTYQMLINER
ncbi:hypothetical protein CCZ01_07440 [Helicobacter monodelphidis]|uniref:glycosyltransferase n=1 Tax=Helicobacter sp. 15-1451 TaxID=2004995 RepID=UPI000DCD360C|nr:glycosyltransferase [Helicobacter sp. 15-1451]RAX57068.1 hypothetical protein CCZ01_07440 [Helicobacter sp. 15-1451]